MPKVPPGKAIAYWYMKTKVKKFVQLQAVKQEVSESEYAEACIEQAMKSPPRLKEENRGRRKAETSPEGPESK